MVPTDFKFSREMQHKQIYLPDSLDFKYCSLRMAKEATAQTVMNSE
jgi:hypothetical protein